MQSGNVRGVQQAEVSAAADALLAQGQRPTVERVRRQLGRGSPNTVGPMLEAWFVGLAPRLGFPATENEVVDAAPAEIRQAMQVLWHLALEMARKEARTALGTERELLQAQQHRLDVERDALAIETAALAERDSLRNAALARAQVQTDEVAQQLRETQVTLQQRDGELGSVRVSLARVVEAKDAALLEHQLSIQRFSEERRGMEERFSATERRHLEEVDRARQEAKSMQKLLTESEGRFAVQRKTWEESSRSETQRIQELQSEAVGLRARLVASEKRISDLRDLAAMSRARPKAIRRRHKSAP